MKSFNLTLSGKHFICPSILNDSFAGQSILGCRSLPFMTSNTSFQPLLAYKVSFEKSADSLMGTPLQVTVSFSLAAFKILSFSLILGNLMMMCLGGFLFGSNFFGTLWASQTSWKSISFTRLGKFSFITHLNKFSFSCCCSSPSGTPIIQILEHFRLSQRFLCLSSFFLDPCFFILFWSDVYFFLLLQIVALTPGFLPVTVGSLNILLYFILGIFHLFFYFSTKLNQFCEHFDYQGFKFSIRLVGYILLAQLSF